MAYLFFPPLCGCFSPKPLPLCSLLLPWPYFTSTSFFIHFLLTSPLAHCLFIACSPHVATCSLPPLLNSVTSCPLMLSQCLSCLTLVLRIEMKNDMQVTSLTGHLRDTLDGDTSDGRLDWMAIHLLLARGDNEQASSAWAFPTPSSFLTSSII